LEKCIVRKVKSQTVPNLVKRPSLSLCFRKCVPYKTSIPNQVELNRKRLCPFNWIRKDSNTHGKLDIGLC